MEKILRQIIDKRFDRIKVKGTAFGADIPLERTCPVIKPDMQNGFIICEIKRGSPSEGLMNDIEDPVKWAADYIESGAGVISVLTEEDYFYGSLNDLIAVKNNFKNACILRKDFLVNEDEIDISFRTGADIVLLIASVLLDLDENKSVKLLKSMKDKAESLGMKTLIEVHNIDELNEILKLNPEMVGINSRDLSTFRINKGYVYGLKKMIGAKTAVVFESGIKNYTDAFFAGMSGFKSLLAGTGIVKSGNIRDKITELKNGFTEGIKNKNDFFIEIFNKIFIQKKTVVKICGITNEEDAFKAVELGADIIGFVFADSPRKISFEKAKIIAGKLKGRVLTAGVVVDKEASQAADCVREGWLNALQFHGDQDNDYCMSFNVSWYKALRIKDREDFKKKYYCPFVLYDSFNKDVYGGTGKAISDDLLRFAADSGFDLFLAGGINNDNIDRIIDDYAPLMVDVSSGLEEFPGKKSFKKMADLFKIINKKQ